jgi:hypothetical protein
MRAVDGYFVIKPEDLCWRPSTLMKIPNPKQLPTEFERRRLATEQQSSLSPAVAELFSLDVRTPSALDKVCACRNR